MTQDSFKKRKHVIKAAWMILISAVCGVIIWRLVNWPAVASNLSKIDYESVVPICVLLILSIFLVRAIRWVVVANLNVQLRSIVSAYFYVSVAVSLGLVTPLQMGEGTKLLLARHFSALGLSSSIPALLLERLMDVIVLLGLFAGARMIIQPNAAALFGALAVSTAVAGLWFAPHIAQKFGIFSSIGYSLSAFRFCAGIVLTVLSWSLTMALWSTALRSVGIRLDPYGLITMICGATASTMVSLAPGGLGLTDLSVHAILVAQGFSNLRADAGMISLRLLTPLMLLVGAAHILPLTLPWRSVEPMRTDD